MAKKSKAKARKRVPTKDLEPKDVKDVKGGEQISLNKPFMVVKKD